MKTNKKIKKITKHKRKSCNPVQKILVPHNTNKLNVLISRPLCLYGLYMYLHYNVTISNQIHRPYPR